MSYWTFMLIKKRVKYQLTRVWEQQWHKTWWLQTDFVVIDPYSCPVGFLGSFFTLSQSPMLFVIVPPPFLSLSHHMCTAYQFWVFLRSFQADSVPEIYHSVTVNPQRASPWNKTTSRIQKTHNTPSVRNIPPLLSFLAIKAHIMLCF